ncbi:MAG: hypothetical protein WB802_07535 [Candidatus Dormiibacterota bacterium]|jgi:hypothetical protein
MRLARAIQEAGVDARLLGGVGVVLHAHGPIPHELARTHHDVDYIVRQADSRAWRQLLVAQGYEEDAQFNMIHGHQRLLHWDRLHERQLDTFVDDFEMCHRLALHEHWGGPPGLLTPADLLLTKLQVVEINDKDLTDALLLLAFHPVGGSGPEEISAERIGHVVGSDWGWYATVQTNLEKLASRAQSITGDDDLRALLGKRITSLQAMIEEAPRSLRWRLRAMVGRRMAWYELPEEPD